MHQSFASTIAAWQNFYMLAGAASATRMGLLFVAVSLHLDLIGAAGAAPILALARRPFSRFILVVIVALLFVVPPQDPRGLGLPLLALGVADALRTLRVARGALSARTRHVGVRAAAQRRVLPVVLPFLSSLGLLLVAATVLAGSPSFVYWLVPRVALLLTHAATNAWDLMRGLARYKLHRAGAPTSRGGGTDGGDAGPARPP